MKLPEIAEAKLKLQNGNVFTLLNPIFEDKNGVYWINGQLNSNDFTNMEDLHRNFSLSQNSPENTSILLEGKNVFGRMITASDLEIYSLSTGNLSIDLVCYGCITESTSDTSSKKDFLNSISIEGLQLWFKSMTRTKSERIILGETKNLNTSSKRDYSEHTLSFTYESKKIDLNLTFHLDNSIENLVHLVVENKSEFDLEIYYKIRLQLRAFLSFPTGNTLFFRRESFVKNSEFYQTFYSAKETKQKVYSHFINIIDPINNNDVFQDYLNCFGNFLIIDQHFDLTNTIFLFNQAKKTALESGVFLMLVAMEKLGDRFNSSTFNTNPNNFIVDKNQFDSLIGNTIKTFENDFNTIGKQELGNFKSKIGGLNKKGKTDRKIDDLLDFVGITKTPEIDQLYPIIRNEAIHEGKVGEENGYTHYKTLKKLLHDAISNLIHYQGLRHLGMTNGKHQMYRIEKFNFELKSQE